LERLIGAAVLVGIAGVGLVRLLGYSRSLNQRVEFANEFMDLFGRYVQSGARDERVYAELTVRVNKMQRHLGRQGIISYRPPFANYIQHGYAVLINQLPELRSAAGHRLFPDFANQHVHVIRDALLRHVGTLQEGQAELRPKLRNPLSWFAEGTLALASVPLTILRAFGLLGSDRAAHIEASSVFRLLAGVGGLVAFLASVVTILTGWAVVREVLRAFRIGL
jgi:hypothetical protein